MQKKYQSTSHDYTDINVQLYEEDGSAWNTYVACHPDSTNYHRYDWRSVVEKSFGHMTYYLVARESNNEICGVLPLVYMESTLFGKFLVSLPFFNYGGILSNSAEIAASLREKSQNILADIQGEYVELRHLAMLPDFVDTKQHKVSMVLELEKDEDSHWKILDPKVRNQIRKAEKSGLQVVTGHSELLDGFYEVFCRNMRDLGTPVYGKDFFRNILESFPDTTRIISVMINEKTVAAGILTWFRDTLEVPWASSIREYREMCPNNLLYWEAIKFAIGNNARKFDFGRSTPDEGTYRFKKQWGSQPVQLYWQYLLGNGKSIRELNPGNPKYHFAIKVWQHLPVMVTNAIGPYIVKNIP